MSLKEKSLLLFFINLGQSQINQDIFKLKNYSLPVMVNTSNYCFHYSRYVSHGDEHDTVQCQKSIANLKNVS